MNTPDIASLPAKLRWMIADGLNMGICEETIDLDVLKEAAGVLESPPHQHLRGAHVSAKVEGCLLCEAITERNSLRAALASPAGEGGLPQVVAEMRERARECLNEDRSVGMFADPEMADLLNEWADRLATPEQPGSSVQRDAIATLHADGYWTWKGTPPHESNYAGWKMDVFATTPPAPAAEQGDEVQKQSPLPTHANLWTAAQQSGGPTIWERFPGWLIDNCEGQTLTEEMLQRELAAMMEATPNPVRAEHPGSSVQGEAFAWFPEAAQWQLDELDEATIHSTRYAHKTPGFFLYTTPPPAPAAEQGDTFQRGDRPAAPAVGVDAAALYIMGDDDFIIRMGGRWYRAKHQPMLSPDQFAALAGKAGAE